MPKIEVTRTTTKLAHVLSAVFHNPITHQKQTVFSTLDDGWGMDRVREWAKVNRFEIPVPKV